MRMEISLKRIGQPAKTITVSEASTIADLLPRVANDFAVESGRISLLYNGTPLSDKNRSLKDYSIKSGDKVMVVIKSTTKPTFEQDLLKYLETTRNSHDAQAIASRFMALLSKTLDSLSLDDIDRLANAFSKSG